MALSSFEWREQAITVCDSLDKPIRSPQKKKQKAKNGVVDF